MSHPIKYAKKQGNTTHNKEENQSVETDPAMTWMVKQVDKNIK